MTGRQSGLITLTFSQVTTWIFARSLMNAVILGFYYGIWGKRDNIPLWSYLSSFILAMIAAALYFTESSGHTHFLGDIHQYTKLPYLTIAVLAGGCLGFWIGDKTTVGTKKTPSVRT